MRIRMCMCIYVHVYAYVYLYVHTYSYVYTYVHTYTHIYIYVYTYIHIYTHVYIPADAAAEAAADEAFSNSEAALGFAQAALGRAVRSMSAVRAHLISASDNSPTERISDMYVCVCVCV